MKLIYIVFGIIVLLLSGCVGSSIYGTYIQAGSVLVLQEDGTYLYTAKDSQFTNKGIYTQNKAEIQLTSILGTTVRLKITSSGLIDEDNELWLRGEN